METAIFTPMLISLTRENRSKMNVNYKLLGLLPILGFYNNNITFKDKTTIKMDTKLKYGGRKVKIVENIDFRLIWQFQEVIGQ